MKDINKFFSSLCDRHCWLSRTICRTQISLIGRARETVLFMSFSDKKVTQLSGFPPTSVSYLSIINSGLYVDQFSNMTGYLGEFFQDLCGILIESHQNYQRIHM